MINPVAIQGLGDVQIKNALQALNEDLRVHPFTNSEFRPFELDLDEAVTAYKVRHGLSYIPTDVIQTSAIGSGTVTWLYSSFDETYVYLTTTDAVKVRFLVGRFKT